MNEILDENMEVEIGSRYSKLSFLVSITSLSLIMYLISLVPKKLEELVYIEPPVVSAMLLNISVILGVIFTVLNIRKKEKWNYLRKIGNTLNIAMAIVVFGLIIFTKVLDYLRDAG